MSREEDVEFEARMVEVDSKTLVGPKDFDPDTGRLKASLDASKLVQYRQILPVLQRWCRIAWLVMAHACLRKSRLLPFLQDVLYFHIFYELLGLTFTSVV